MPAVKPDSHQAAAGEPVSPESGGIARLRAIMRQLRDPVSGCPWDIEQDFESIAPCTIEEAYEVADAISREDWPALKSELGDLLLQTVYHSQIASELGLFGFDDVVEAVSQKMTDRHPHVFGDADGRTAAEQAADWERMKAAERRAVRQGGALDGIATALPALTRALKLQKRAARCGFDWPGIEGVLEKIAEEAAEAAAELKSGSASKVSEEIGDLLFTLVNFARHSGVDPEAALRAANGKFQRRFADMETQMRHDGVAPEELSAEWFERYWEKAKARS